MVSDEKLIDALSRLFRERGFDGVSIGDISHESGLQKSSLYHRCPGGKDEMALLVIDAITAHLRSHVVAPLAGSGDLARRLRRVSGSLVEVYGDGQINCLLESLSLGASPEIRAALDACLSAWVDAFTAIAREAGLRPSEAARRSRQAIARIQGALVLSRISSDPTAFREAIADLPTTLGVR